MWICVQEFYEKRDEYVQEKQTRDEYMERLQQAQDRLAPLEKELAEGRDKLKTLDAEYAAKVSNYCTMTATAITRFEFVL